MARREPGWRRDRVHRAGCLAEPAHRALDRGRRLRLRDTADRGQSPVRLHATGQQRGHDGAGSRLGRPALANELPGPVRDELGDPHPRTWTEVDPHLGQRPAVHPGHERDRLRLRRRDRTNPVAASGAAHRAALPHGDVAAGGRRSRDPARGWPRRRRAHRLRRGHGRGPVELGRRRAGLRLADALRVGWRASGRDVHAGKPDRRIGGDRPALLAPPVYDTVHDDVANAHSPRGPGHRGGPLERHHRVSSGQAGRRVDDRGTSGTPTPSRCT